MGPPICFPTTHPRLGNPTLSGQGAQGMPRNILRHEVPVVSPGYRLCCVLFTDISFI